MIKATITTPLGTNPPVYRVVHLLVEPTSTLEIPNPVSLVISDAGVLVKAWHSKGFQPLKGYTLLSWADLIKMAVDNGCPGDGDEGC